MVRQGKVLNWRMLERLKTAVHKKLIDNETGFRQVRSCIDQNASLYNRPVSHSKLRLTSYDNVFICTALASTRS